jgi:hypothetical protein
MTTTARRIASALVAEQLAACVNVIDDIDGERLAFLAQRDGPMRRELTKRSALERETKGRSS